MNTINWIGMDAETIENRKRKNREIRICRKYLARAKEMGLGEKSTTVRKYQHILRELRGEAI